MPKKLNLAGSRFGRLVVIGEAGRTSGGHITWNCVCDCGSRSVVAGKQLRSGHTKSCGCYRFDACVTHGMKGTKTYGAWVDMLQRCTNQRNRNYRNYGARGIFVCDRWRSFVSFLEDMGEAPKGRSIDRIDVNGNYEPGNCRWATAAEQALNKQAHRKENVGIRSSGKKFVAYVKDHGTYRHLGTFESIELARDARATAFAALVKKAASDAATSSPFIN